jgi:hypothetical protein
MAKEFVYGFSQPEKKVEINYNKHYLSIKLKTMKTMNLQQMQETKGGYYVTLILPNGERVRVWV